MNPRTDHGPAVETKQSRNRLRLLWTAIMILSGILLFFQLGSYHTLRRHEAYVGVSAREMLASGDWLIPRFGGQPRLEKPPLGYWFVASLGWLQGEIDEWTVRCPAAISALLLVAFMGFWGTRWYGIRGGLSAAFILATSSFTIIWGRTGVIDLPLTLLTTSGLYLFANFCCQRDSSDRKSFVQHSQSPSRQLILAYCLLGLSSLAKPAFGLILVMLTCTAFLLIQRRVRWLFYLANPVGLAIAVLLTFAWPYLVSQQAPQVWQVWFTETVGRAVGATHYQEPFWFYTSPVLFLLAPWTPLIIAAVPNSWHRAWYQGDTRERFLWVCFLSQFLALSFSVGKSEKYILPALPPLCLIGAQKLASLATLSSGKYRTASAKWAVYTIALSLAILATAVVVSSHRWPELTVYWVITATLLGIGLSLGVYFWMQDARACAVWSIAGAGLACYLMIIGAVVPHFDRIRPAAQFSRQVAALTPPEQQLIVYGLNRPPIVFYLPRQIAVEEKLAAIQRRLAGERTLYVLTSKPSMKELEALGDTLLLLETDRMFRSHNDYQDGLALVKITLRLNEPTD